MNINIKDHTWQIICNPNALTKKRRTVFENLLQSFDNERITYSIHVADGERCGMELAERLCRDGHRHLIMVGGDGSINEAVNGIYRSGVNPGEVFLGILPLGTGNDFCRSLHLPAADRMFPVFSAGRFEPTDAGVVESVVDGKVVDSRYFINIAGFAFDGAVIAQTNGPKPKLLPGAVYMLKLAKVLFSYRATPVTIRTRDKSLSESMFTIAVGNGQYNGNGMRQVPMGDIHDRQLDVVAIRKISPFKVMRNVGRLFSGKHIALKEVKTTRTDYVEILSEKPLHGEVEGEMLTPGNYRISVAEGQINVLCC